MRTENSTDLTIQNTLADVHKKKIKGFLADDEALALYHYAYEVSVLGPCLEVGSYCGKSSIFIGEACRQNGSVLYAVDHHRGSEEHQPGEEYHDKELLDDDGIRLDSFKEFRKNIESFSLHNVVIPVVSDSKILAKHWHTPLAMVFVDGGHSPEASMHDCLEWSKHLVHGGLLAVHDVFKHPEEGGQGPYWALSAVLKNGNFQLVQTVSSLAIVRAS